MAEGPIFTHEAPDTGGGLPACFLSKRPPFGPVNLTGVRLLHRKRRPVIQGRRISTIALRRSLGGGPPFRKPEILSGWCFYGANSTFNQGAPISRSAPRRRFAEGSAILEAINLPPPHEAFAQKRPVPNPETSTPKMDWGGLEERPPLRNPVIMREGCVYDVRCRFRWWRPGCSWWGEPPRPQRPEIASDRGAIAFRVLISYVVI